MRHTMSPRGLEHPRQHEISYGYLLHLVYAIVVGIITLDLSYLDSKIK